MIKTTIIKHNIHNIDLADLPEEQIKQAAKVMAQAIDYKLMGMCYTPWRVFDTDYHPLCKPEFKVTSRWVGNIR